MSTTAFVGRAAELQLLKDAWLKAKVRQPQIINIIANTGVGKTRLVHAFYHWLSTASDQGDGSNETGYWPDDLGIGRQRVVNPPLECFAPFDLKRRAIPWLWWGMYWTDVAGEKEPAFNRFSHYLELHLELIEAEQNFKKNILHSSLELGFEEIVNASGEFIPGVGTVINIAKFAKKLYNSKKKQEGNLKGVAECNIKDANQQIDNLMARLSVLLNPTKKEKLALPMVLFLDDLQFSTEYHKDASTMLFLERFLRKGLTESWPLLVVTTHWKTEWNFHKAQQANHEQSWYQLLERVKSDVETASGVIKTVELANIPKIELQQIMLNSLPGLSQQNQVTILGQIDNARWLLELLIALNDNQNNFIGNNRQQALSSYGEKRLNELLRSRDYLDVIRKRLESDAMKDIRVILGATAWHTSDLEFISSLTQAFSEPLVRFDMITVKDGDASKTIRSLLLQALDPGAYIEGGTRDGQLAELIRFPERGYLDVAKALFDTSRLPDLQKSLGLLIIDWLQRSKGDCRIWQRLAHDEQKVFLQIAVKVLESLQPSLSSEQEVVLSAKEATLRELLTDGTIDEELLTAKLKVARLALLDMSEQPSIPNATLWKHVALAELVERYQHDGDGRAWALALELAKSADMKELTTLTTFKAATCLAEIFSNVVELWPIAESLLSQLILRLWPAVDRGDEKLFLLYLHAIRSLSDLYEIQGNLDLCRVQLLKALDVIDSMYVNAGKQKNIDFEKQKLLISLADLDRVEGKTSAAREGYQSGLSIINQLLIEHGETTDVLQGLSSNLERLADLDKAEGRMTDARATYTRSLAIHKQLLAKFGDKPELLRNLMFLYGRLGELNSADGNIDAARVNYEQSVSICERLITDFGETPRRQQDLIDMLQFLIGIDFRPNNLRCLPGSYAGYKRILEVNERLISNFGETPERLRDLALVSTHIAVLNSGLGRNLQEARIMYTRSLDIYERLLLESGETPEGLRDVTIELEHIAGLDWHIGKLDSARAGYARSLAIRKQILEIFGDNPARLLDLADSYCALAGCELSAGALEAARESYSISLAIHERLLVEYSESSKRQQGVTRILRGLLELSKKEGNLDEELDRGIHFLAIMESFPSRFDTPDRLDELVELYFDFALEHFERGSYIKASMVFERSASIAEKVITNFGSSEGRLFYLEKSLAFSKILREKES